MGDSDRLVQLRQQRALVAQHLAWLDAEISRAAPSPAPVLDRPSSHAPTAGSQSPESLAGSPSPPEAVASSAQLDELFEELVEKESAGSSISKSGCWVIFAGVCLFGAAILVGFILFRYR